MIPILSASDFELQNWHCRPGDHLFDLGFVKVNAYTNNKYFYAYHICSLNFFNTSHNADPPEKVIKDLKSKKAFLLLDNSWEGWAAWSGLVTFINDFCIKYDFPISQVVYADGNVCIKEAFAEYDFHKVFLSVWPTFIYPTVDRYVNAADGSRFLCLNRRYSHSRAAIVKWLLENIPAKQAQISFHGLHAEGMSDSDAEFFADKLPIVLDNKDGDNKTDVSHQLIYKNHIHIVTETFFYQGKNHVFLSEKSFKPIVTRNPFIIVGLPNTLKALREKFNFQTFSPMINEEYDSEMDDVRRMELIQKEIARLSSLSDKEFAALIESCEEIVNANFLRYITLFLTNNYAKESVAELEHLIR